MDRARFFNGYWSLLRAKGWSAIVLHGWQRLPETIESDVDYSVAGVSPVCVLRLLLDYCGQSGWRFLQLIEHEPGAFFCTCVRMGKKFEVIGLDLTGAYRRCGHPLLSATLLHAGAYRPFGKAFDVPAAGAEAAYLIAKAAAKGKNIGSVTDRLHELSMIDSDSIDKVLPEAFFSDPPPTPGPCGAKWVNALGQWYEQTPEFRSLRRGRRLGAAEIALYWRRICDPTGVRVSLGGQSSKVVESAMLEAISAFEPLFRRRVTYTTSSFVIGLKSWVDTVRTRLVVFPGRSGRPGSRRQDLILEGGADLSTADYAEVIADKLEDRVRNRIEQLGASFSSDHD
jgi:hypothetical protein